MARIVLSRLGSSANSFGMTNIFRFPLIESLSRSSENKIRQEIHTSSALLIGQRKGKKVRTITNRVREKLTKTDRSPYWRQPEVVPSSPLTRTDHPKNRFAEEDVKLQEAIAKASQEHQPELLLSSAVCENNDNAEVLRDPYNKEPIRCILCPRRYSVDYIKPDYKNPKLLAQFVSPHTGLVYKKHITGLCQQMQDAVEIQVKRAQHAGFLATKVKEMHYLKDPPLFDPARPTRRNPY